MEKRQRVILYGDTLVLTGVRLSLEANPAFEIIPLDASYITGQDGLTGQELLTLQPDIVIFDTSSVQPQFHSSLIQEQSGLQLIGVDPDRDQVLVWSGRHLRELSLQDLVNIIHQQEPNSEISRRQLQTWRKWWTRLVPNKPSLAKYSSKKWIISNSYSRKE